VKSFHAARYVIYRGFRRSINKAAESRKRHDEKVEPGKELSQISNFE